MRISDWSSDVCSSDLRLPREERITMATPTAAFSICLRVRLDNRPGTLGRLATAIGEVGGNITAIGGFDARGSHPDEDLLVNRSSEYHIEQVTAAVRANHSVDVRGVRQRTVAQYRG